jgi:ABC-type transporter Mla maintaining outer membrane lipid asymmetry ATPase subunit MlaF
MSAALKLPTGTPAMEMRQVDIASARADEVTVIGQVDWRVAPGDFWVIGSHAGTGKTALLQTAAGVQRPLAGQLSWFGQPHETLREAELLTARLRMGLVFEGGGRNFSGLTVAENIALPYCYHHNCGPDAVADQLVKILDYIGLAACADQLPSTAPRSMCGRIGLARALITEPEVLLLDNPLHGFDERERAWWCAHIQDLAGQGTPWSAQPLTVVVATDDVRPWLDLGNRFAVVRSRQFQDLGDRAAIHAGGATASVHDLLALAPVSG